MRALILLASLLCVMLPALGDDAATGDDVRARYLQALEQILAERAAAEAVPAPVPDDLDEALLPPAPEPLPQPAIEYEVLAKVAAAQPRLPRGVLLSAPWCTYCERMKRELPDLIGGPDAAIEVIDTTKPNNLAELGVSPGMIQQLPTLFVLDASGRIHSFDGGFGCKLTGYQTRAQVTEYLTLAEHGVSLDATAEPQPTAVASLQNCEPSIDAAAAALSWHLLQQADPDQATERTFGTLINIDASLPDGVLTTVRRLLVHHRLDFPDAGLSVDWTGPKHQLLMEPDRITFQPGLKVTVSKFRLTKSATLNAVSYPPDLASVTAEISGLPDVTIHFAND